MPNDTLRDVLSAEYDRMDAEPTATPAPAASETTMAPAPAAAEAPASTETAVPAEAPASTAGPARDAAGRFAKAEKPPEAPAEKAPETKPAAPGATQTATPAPAQGAPTVTPPATTETLRAPQSWTPAAREEWAKVPAAAQREILRLEGDTRRVMQESAELRKESQRFQQAVAPYSAMLASEGIDAVHASADLLRQAYLLRTGAPQQRAKLLAGWIQQSGVPIDLLAQALDAAPTQQQPQALDPEAIIRQAEQRVEQRMKAARDQHLTTRAQADWAKFSQSHEFAEDLRQKIGVLVGAASQQGVAMTLEEAYNMAVAMDPQVSGVLKQRQAAGAAATAQAATQRAMAASSSVRSAPAVAAAAPPKGLRAVLEAEYDKIAAR